MANISGGKLGDEIRCDMLGTKYTGHIIAITNGKGRYSEGSHICIGLVADIRAFYQMDNLRLYINDCDLLNDLSEFTSCFWVLAGKYCEFILSIKSPNQICIGGCSKPAPHKSPNQKDGSYICSSCQELISFGEII